MHQYVESKERVRHLRKTIYKVHPKWKKRRVVRLVLLLILLLCLIASLLCLRSVISSGVIINDPYQDDETYKIFSFFEYFMSIVIGICFIPGMVYILYCYVLRGSCRGGLQFKMDQTLILSDTELRNIFGDRAEDSNIKTEISFPYADIKRVVWNECQQRFEIYGISTRIHYVDFERDKVDSRSKHKGNLKEPYHIAWVYPVEKLEEFKTEITKATGLPVELKTEATE